MCGIGLGDSWLDILGGGLRGDEVMVHGGFGVGVQVVESVALCRRVWSWEIDIRQGSCARGCDFGRGGVCFC